MYFANADCELLLWSCPNIERFKSDKHWFSGWESRYSLKSSRKVFRVTCHRLMNWLTLRFLLNTNTGVELQTFLDPRFLICSEFWRSVCNRGDCRHICRARNSKPSTLCQMVSTSVHTCCDWICAGAAHSSISPSNQAFSLRSQPHQPSYPREDWSEPLIVAKCFRDLY